MTYGKRTLIAVDQLINTLLGGWPDETLSSRCYRWARDGVSSMAPACRGRAVLLAEGALQEQLSKGEEEAVAAGVKREKGYSINNKKELPYSIPSPFPKRRRGAFLFPKKEGHATTYAEEEKKSFAVRTVNVIKR